MKRGREPSKGMWSYPGGSLELGEWQEVRGAYIGCRRAHKRRAYGPTQGGPLSWVSGRKNRRGAFTGCSDNRRA